MIIEQVVKIKVNEYLNTDFFWAFGVSANSDKSIEPVAYGYGIRKFFHGGFEFLGSYGRSIGAENLMFYNKDKDVCISILSSSNMKKDKTLNIDELMYEIFECL